MNKTLIIDIAAYIFQNYPNPNQLSKPRLVKLFYLLDWKSSIDYSTQVTSINWYFNHYGPYVEEIIQILENATSEFEVISYKNPYNHGTTVKFKLLTNKQRNLSDNVKKILNLLIEHTSKMNWSQFISLVYNTYPIKNNSKYTTLNLVEAANKYRMRKAPANRVDGSTSGR